MKEEVYILVDTNVSKTLNYIGIHKHKEGAENHRHYRQLKTKQNIESLIIKKGYITFD